MVTGCSSGIGAATARLLSEHGWQVIATARRPDDLERLRIQGLTAVPLDLAVPQSVENAAAEILHLCGGRLGALVNNAGFGQPGAIEDLERAEMRRQFDVNVIGLQDFTNRFIPAFRLQGAGRIVNVSSVVGRIALPFLGIYSASKFALEAISDVLRVELRGSGISVSIIEPGPIATRFGENATRAARVLLEKKSSPFAEAYRRYVENSIERPSWMERFRLPPESVARAVLHALESRRPRRRYPVTFPAVVGGILQRLAPYALIDHLLWKRLCTRVPRRSSPPQEI